ncbi:MAG TPA: cell envelope biogenesis protein OmpA, partial [Gammaproteobacteria bacterium]|nr:cell envelope biogenesis protein OmpA [Gammaproteobacteria bacterium]
MLTTRKLPVALLTAAVALSLGGCEKVLDPYTGQEKTSNTSKNSAIGAGIGALVGYLSARDKSRRDKRKAILIGAGVGGLTGAAVGSYMDKQEDELRQQLQGTGVSVTRSGDELILNMPGNITFATDSSALNPSFHEVLNSVVLILKKFDKTLIEVAGHTDSTGSAEYNKKLSWQRAQSVANYLIDQGV